jgi:Ca2+-binding EF-hand superfamily protein
MSQGVRGCLITTGSKSTSSKPHPPGIEKAASIPKQTPVRRAASSKEDRASSKGTASSLLPRRKNAQEDQKHQNPTLDTTIKRVVCGQHTDGAFYDAKIPAERQTTYLTDGIQAERVLTGTEKASIFAIFNEIACSSQEDKNVNPNKVAIQFKDLARRLQGQLSSAHIQRLSTYLNFTKRVRQVGYLDRMSIFISAGAEDRLRICFGILDSDGDGALGARDIFAALGSTRRKDRPGNTGLVDACFHHPGRTGITFNENHAGRFEVAAVEHISHAEHAGVEVNDYLVQINGQEVDALTPEAVRSQLCDPARPLRLQFYRGSQHGPDTGMLCGFDFEKLFAALQSHQRMRLKVTIIGARGLRNTDQGVGGKSDPYCTCEVYRRDVTGKPHTKFHTKVISDTLDPVWNDTRYVADFTDTDSVKFTVKASTKEDEILGHCILGKKQLLPNGFEGEVIMTDAEKNGKGVGAAVRVKVSVMLGGGIGFSEFKQVFAHREPNFFARLCEELTGFIAPRQTKASKVMKIRIMVIAARGLRNADMVGKSDPYCICEIVGKPQTRSATKALLDTLDPVWNEQREVPLYVEGDSLRLSIYDKDAWSKGDDLLGQVTLPSSQFYPMGFDGELKLIDAGKGFNPVLKVRITVVGAPHHDKELTPEEKSALATETEAGQRRHENEINEIRSRRIWLSAVDVAWFVNTFDIFCGHDRLIHKIPFRSKAEKLFELPCNLLADRFFDLVDEIEMGDKSGTLCIRSWAMMLERLSHGNWHQKTEIAFKLYDIDGDGVISVEDALNLVREEGALSELAQQLPQDSLGTSLFHEMNWVYNSVADSTNDVEADKNKIHDFWWFKQVRPEPSIINVVLKRLKALGDGVADLADSTA